MGGESHTISPQGSCSKSWISGITSNLRYTSSRNDPDPNQTLGRSANKAGYFDKLKGLLEEHSSIFIVGVDNVSVSTPRCLDFNDGRNC